MFLISQPFASDEICYSYLKHFDLRFYDIMAATAHVLQTMLCLLFVFVLMQYINIFSRFYFLLSLHLNLSEF
jgi:hypothetical protein